MAARQRWGQQVNTAARMPHAHLLVHQAFNTMFFHAHCISLDRHSLYIHSLYIHQRRRRQILSCCMEYRRAVQVRVFHEGGWLAGWARWLQCWEAGSCSFSQYPTRPTLMQQQQFRGQEPGGICRRQQPAATELRNSSGCGRRLLWALHAWVAACPV